MQDTTRFPLFVVPDSVELKIHSTDMNGWYHRVWWNGLSITECTTNVSESDFKRPFAATVPAVAALGIVFEAHKVHPCALVFSRQHQPSIVHSLCQSPSIAMLDDQSRAEPL